MRLPTRFVGRRGLIAFVAAALAAPVALTALPARAAAPEVGAPAPDFVFEGQGGATYRLADYRGEKAVVIAWFPKAFTAG